MEYMVVIEQGEDSYGAYVPDLPGCVALEIHGKKSWNLFKRPLFYIWKCCETMGYLFLGHTQLANMWS